VTAARPIGRAEHLERQEHARALARERGYTGVLAWARGGSTQDHYADVLYLTGFYTHYPVLLDEPGRWRARGHAAAVVPVDGPSTAVVDVTQHGEREVAADSVRQTADVLAGVADAIRAGVEPGRVALLGGDALAARWHAGLVELLPDHELVEDDDLATELRLIKSPAELELLRAAGALGVRAVEAAMDAAVPGAAESELAAAAVSEIVGRGGALYGMGLASGPLAHTFAPITPAAYRTRRLEPGDMVRLDLYGSVEGYLFDFGRSRVVGAEPTPEQQAILDAVRDSVLAGVEVLRPGAPLAAVAERCEEVFGESDYVARFGVPDSPLGSWGHGLGLAFERPWIEAGATMTIAPGMCLAVERRIEAPGVGGANYEENVIVTADAGAVITAARRRWEV
jgi:Xaa-Pro aminopeptidase